MVRVVGSFVVVVDIDAADAYCLPLLSSRAVCRNFDVATLGRAKELPDSKTPVFERVSEPQARPMSTPLYILMENDIQSSKKRSFAVVRCTAFLLAR